VRRLGPLGGMRGGGGGGPGGFTFNVGDMSDGGGLGDLLGNMFGRGRGGRGAGGGSAGVGPRRGTDIEAQLAVDFEDAVNGVVGGVFPPAGQSCIAGSRLLLQAGIHDSFLERVVAVAELAKLGDPRDPGTHVGPIANRPHYENVLRDIESAAASGARLLLDGRGKGPERGYYIGPTIFAEVTNEMRLAQHEIFGPVVAIVPFDEEDEAVRMANDSLFGLAAGIWTRDTAKAIRMADRLRAGTIWVNTYRAVSFTTPFGGYKRSGIGRESGLEAIKEYCEVKSVWIATEASTANPFVLK